MPSRPVELAKPQLNGMSRHSAAPHERPSNRLRIRRLGVRVPPSALCGSARLAGVPRLTSTFGLEDLHHERLHEVDRLLDVLDVWTAWARGRPGAVADLTNAAEAFADSARRAPLLSGSSGEIDRSHWMELLGPVLELLDQRGVTLCLDMPHLWRRGSISDLSSDLIAPSGATTPVRFSLDANGRRNDGRSLRRRRLVRSRRRGT